MKNMTSEEIIDELQYVEVTENIILTALYPYEVDKLLRLHETAIMSCIALPDELFFVDCGARLDLARKFRQDMEERFERPTSHLFLTHDHWHSNIGMSAFEDVNIVMSSAGRSYYRTNIKKGVYDRWNEWIVQNTPDDEKLRKSLLEASLFMPNIGIPKQQVFGSDTNQIIFKVEKGHTNPSSSVYVSSERTLFTGGNLNTCYAQFIWPTTIIDTYKAWEQLDIEYVVPGHGSIVDKGYISLIRVYFEELLDKLRELKKLGLTKNQVVKQTDLPEYPGTHQKSWVEGSRYHTGAVNRIVKYWYGQVLKEEETEEEDLMFIS